MRFAAACRTRPSLSRAQSSTGATAARSLGDGRHALARGGRLVDPLAQVVARLEVRHVLAGEGDRFAGLGVASLARRPEVQAEAAKTADLDPLPLRQRVAHDLEDLLDRQ